MQHLKAEEPHQPHAEIHYIDEPSAGKLVQFFRVIHRSAKAIKTDPLYPSRLLRQPGNRRADDGTVAS
ncbi:hypothetical protein RvY_12630 [Ramazzottius varieornatus]|uniref:Uncharacterized protein n=1 Tax=Ramazzottius varieornatus TaxID=947166 RepID=A0A1D1VPC8_RAMVA|nr:hypothetical protein RvY_12630 [Ramazzottius varieornatus]